MGSSVSKTRNESRAPDRRDRETDTSSRKPVLLPPIFAVPTKGSKSSPSVYNRIVALSHQNGPSYLKYLHQTHPSTRLFQDFMQPGLWIAAEAAAGTHVRTCIAKELTSNETSNLFQIRLALERSLFDSSSFVQLSGGTDWLPALRGRFVWGQQAALSLSAQTNTNGRGWLLAHLDRTIRFNDEDGLQEANIQLGSAATFDRAKDTSKPVNWIQSVNGYAATNVLGATLAVEATLPVQNAIPNYDAVCTRSSLSMNLSEEDSEGNPPLWLLLERTERAGNETTSAMSLSQTLAFERYQFNPYEDRADQVRNSLTWAIRMERNSNDPRVGMDVSVAAAWQMNRSVALKAVIQPSKQQINTAILLKRWKQPRIACSLLHRYDWTQKQLSFVGLGVELETGRLDRTQQDIYPTKANLVGRESNDDVPKTRLNDDE